MRPSTPIKVSSSHGHDMAETAVEAALAAAYVAVRLARKKGNANKGTLRAVAQGRLLDGIDEHVRSIDVVLWCGDRHSRLRRGTLLTRPGGEKPRFHAVLKPVSCAGQLARTGPGLRPSMVHLLLSPAGTLAALDPTDRAEYLAVPPCSPVGRGGIEFRSAPAEVVALLCEQFECRAEDVHVYILNRPWNHGLADEYRAAGATVIPIPSGDYLALAGVAGTVPLGGPVPVAAGIGAIPEQFLAAALKAAGATLWMQPIPRGREMEAHNIRNRVYDRDELVASQDFVLVSAGVTEADAPAAAGYGPQCVVPGVRRSPLTGGRWVTVLVVSPLLEHDFQIVVEYDDDDDDGRPTVLAPGVGLNGHLLLRLLSAGAVETREKETPAGEVVYFQHGRPEVPGLEGLSERDLIVLLGDLHRRGLVTCGRTPLEYDTTEYRVEWALP